MNVNRRQLMMRFGSGRRHLVVWSEVMELLVISGLFAWNA